MRLNHKKVDEQHVQLAISCASALSAAWGWNMIITQLLPVGILRQFGNRAPGEVLIVGGLLLVWLGSVLYLHFVKAQAWWRAAVASLVVLLIVMPLVIIGLWPFVEYVIQILVGDIQFATLNVLSALLLFVIVLGLNLASSLRLWRRVATAGGLGLVLLLLGEVIRAQLAPDAAGQVAWSYWLYVPLLWVLTTFVAAPRRRLRRLLTM